MKSFGNEIKEDNTMLSSFSTYSPGDIGYMTHPTFEDLKGNLPLFLQSANKTCSKGLGNFWLTPGNAYTQENKSFACEIEENQKKSSLIRLVNTNDRTSKKRKADEYELLLEEEAELFKILKRVKTSKPFPFLSPDLIFPPPK